jgi:hypothetical protein
MITKDGIKPYPEKIQAINDIPKPKTKEQLQTLL